MVERTGMSRAAAERSSSAGCDGVLLPDVVLPFDDEEFAGCTVGDVLADPGALRGRDAGRSARRASTTDACKAQDHAPGRRHAVDPFSFAHGRTIYELKYDAAAVREGDRGGRQGRGGRDVLSRSP